MGGGISIFGVLPPEDTGIAIANYNTFVNIDEFVVFSDLKNFNLLLNSSISNVYSLTSYLYFNSFRINVFIIGNSYHNVPYLRSAVEIVNKKNSYLLLHECNLTSLLIHYYNLNFNLMKNHLLICYPEYSDDLVRINNWEEFGRFNKYFKIFGLRCIRYITGIDNYIVNNDVAEAISRQELGNDIKLVKMFLPLPNLKVNNKKNIKANIVFGTFGVPSHRKFTCEIIEAITILKNIYNLDVALLIAGYKANEFLKNLNIDKSIVYIYDNPNDEEFFELLNSVDYGIQLRKFAYGESSGPITQLLSLKKEVIVNESFVDKNFEDYIYVVEDKNCINSLELAKVLKNILDKNCKLNNINKDLYSFEVLQKLFLELQ